MLIILAALMVPWLRLNALVEDDGIDASRQMVKVWQAMRAKLPAPEVPGPDEMSPAGPTNASSELGIVDATEVEGGWVYVVPGDRVGAQRQREAFVGQAWDEFLSDPKLSEHASATWRLLLRQYKYARAIRDDKGVLEGIIVLERTSIAAARDMLTNTVYLASAGLVALGLAVLAFYLITQYLILSPVRTLRETAEQVRQGNLSIRSEIATGDEFEELADTFNAMLGVMQDSQRSLSAINLELDKRVDALEAQNVSLADANKLKNDFLANVSHELRTPLNSILGFTEILLEQATKELEAGDDSTRLNKRRRYLENITSAGRSLLELINGLLELAKIEAGKVDINVERVDLREAAEGLVALIRPLADKRGVSLSLEIIGDGPLVIESDPRKLQQIVFNFLSNAVKFTGDKVDEERARAETIAAAQGGGSALAPSSPASVTLRVEPLVVRSAGGGEAEDKVRISVLDTGPGIAKEHHDRIFDKFTQLSAGHTRKHAGAGLGLSISKELTQLLQGEVQVQSEIGRGSMFSVILPRQLDQTRTKETKLEARLRGALNRADAV